MPFGFASYDLVSSIVQDDVAPFVQDQIFTSNPFYATLEAGNKVVARGGESIGWASMFEKLNAGSYRGMTPFPSREVDITRRATLEWKQLFVDIVVSEYDLRRASGPLAVVDLADYLRQAATLTASDLMGFQVFGDGFGGGGLDLDGAAVAIDNGDTYPVYAGISRAAPNTWWRGNVNATGGPLSTAAMNTSYGNATINNTHPNLEVTTQTLWNNVLNRVIPQQHFEMGDERNRTARIGFDTIRHLGADLVHDSHVVDGDIWYFNMENIELRIISEDRMWGFTGFKEPTNSDGKQGQLLFFGNLIFYSPRLHARDRNVT